MLGLVGLLAGLAAGEAEREHVALGAPAPLPASHANVSRAIDKAVAAMNVRMAHYCPHQGAFASVELLGAALEVTSDAPLYTLGLRMDGQYNVTVFVRGREDVGKLVFVSSVPYCCSVRSANLANIARDVEKHNADPTRTYDQAVYKAFQGHTYASLARSRLGLLRRPDGSLFAGGGDEWAEPEPSDEGAPLKALEKGRSGSAGTEVEMAAYDFRVAHPACTPKVRDQGSCGSCWAQSSIGAFEDRLCAASGGTLNVKLSVQQQVSCNTLCLPRPDSDLCQGGCAGGFQDLSGAYLEQTGVVEAHVLPYTSGGSGSYEDHFGSTDGKGACPNNVLAQHRHFKARTGSTRQVSRVPSTLMAELSARGPLDVAMVVHNDFWNYKRGVYASGAASPAAGGHAVKMLGYGTDAASGLPYWICQNSWGTAWGEGGFFRAKRGDRIGLEQSAWMTMPIVPAIAVIPDALPPAVTPQAPPPPTPCTGRRCPRSPPPAGSTPSLYDAIVYTFKSFFGLQAAQPPTSGLILSGPRPAGANAAAAHGVQPAPHDRARLAISPEARRARKAAADGAHAERARARASDTAEPGGGEHERRRAHNIDASDARARGWHSGRHDGAAAARSGSADYSGQEEAGWSHVRHEASTVMRDPGAARRADAPDSALRHTRRSSARRSNDRREPDAADTRRADGEDEGDEPVRAHHTHHKEPSPVLSLPGAAAARAPDALGAGSTAVDGADVIGYLRLVSERDGSVAAEQPLTDVDGEVVVDKTALPVGSYAIVLCGVAADGGASERCDTEDDKVHVSRCPLRNGYACGGHGECVTLGSKEGKERGRCKCDDGYGGHECRPTCTSLPKLPSGCALRGGVWDSAEQAPTLDGGAGGALFTVRVHEDCELQLSTCHPFTNFDTHLSIFEGCPLQSAEASVGELPHPLAANDDACDLPDRAGASSISVPLSRGTYTVLVRGFDPHALGDFELSASGCGAPPLEQPPAAALPTSAHAHALFEKGARADRGAHETPDGAEPRAEPRGGRRSERASASATLDQVGEPREKGMRKGVAGATCPPRDTPSLGVGEPCEARAQKIVIGDVLTSMVTHTGGMLYRLTPQLPVTAEFSTCGSALDTEIKLYRGCPLSGGHLLALSDDDCGQGSFFVSSLEQGIDYFLVVNGYEGQPGPFELRVNEAPQLCGDSSLVTPLTLGLSPAQFDELGREREARVLELSGETCARSSLLLPHSSPDALYSLQLPSPADVEVHTCASNSVTAFDSVLHLVTSCFNAPDSVELVRAGFSHLMPSCRPGERGAALTLALPAGRFGLAVSSETTACGPYQLSVRVTPAPPVEVGDDVAAGAANSSARVPLGASMAMRAPMAIGGTKDGCQCASEWAFHGERFHGCDARRPRKHGTWCPVNGTGCGHRMHHADAHALVADLPADGAGLFFDWCRASPEAQRLGVQPAAAAATSALRGARTPAWALSGALAALLAAGAASVAAAVPATRRLRRGGTRGLGSDLL